MNRKEILEKLKEVPLEREDFIVIAEASMVVQKVKSKTDDIDISVSKEVFEKLKKEYKEKTDIYGNVVINLGDITIGTYFYDKDNIIIIEGYNFESLEKILEKKKRLTHEKDKKDIKLLELFLAMKDNYKYERELNEKGITLIAGVDEVGRGPLVGPVVAASVILPKDYTLEGLTDSKKLSEKKRDYFYEIIKKDALSIGIGIIDNEKIDEVNIYEATKLAMKEAINNLSIKPEYILSDAMKLDLDIPVIPIIKGDLKSITIAASSVIAKVTRDKMMYDLDKKYPFYNFKNNKGYPTKDHIEAIEKYGIIKEHRKSYAPIKNMDF